MYTKACFGTHIVEGTKKPSLKPSKFTQFTAECSTCHQRVELQVNTSDIMKYIDIMKYHEVRVEVKPLPNRR